MAIHPLISGTAFPQVVTGGLYDHIRIYLYHYIIYMTLYLSFILYLCDYTPLYIYILYYIYISLSIYLIFKLYTTSINEVPRSSQVHFTQPKTPLYPRPANSSTTLALKELPCRGCFFWGKLTIKGHFFWGGVHTRIPARL